MLHTIATEPAHTLQSLTDGIRFRSVVFMASPVQLIRTVGQAVSGLVPPNLATLATSGIGNPFEQALGVTRTAVERWVSITGDLDPIGGHFVRRKCVGRSRGDSGGRPASRAHTRDEQNWFDAFLTPA